MKNFKKSILVISNNPFRNDDNNGKTLVSLFSSFTNYEISQLYFSSKQPNDLITSNFYSITEAKMLFKAKDTLKIIDKKTNNGFFPALKKILFNSMKNSSFVRLAREVLWKKKNWCSTELNKWLDEIKPDLVFFLAGDAEFAFNITKYIVTKFDSKLVVYITDEYYYSKNVMLNLAAYRKYRLRNKLKGLLNKTNLLLTISNEMKELYLRLFQMNSIIYINTPNIETYKIKKNGHFLYAGGLGLGRFKSLLSLAYALDKYNFLFGSKIELHVFSSSINDENFQKYTFKSKSLRFFKPVDSKKLYYLYSKYSYLVHVESFEKKYINKTRYSISTKIPEYLYSGSKIIAIGDKNLSSIKFLKNSAFIIDDSKKIFNSLFSLFNMSMTSPKIDLNVVDSIAKNKIIILDKIEGLLT